MATLGPVRLEHAEAGPVAHRPGFDAEEAGRLSRTQQRVVGVVQNFGVSLNTHHTHQTFATPASTG